MSRVIVKNLPGRVTEKRLRELFAQRGEVTDVKLMKTRSGAPRRFGFVGFISESQAEAAANHFNNTFIDASRICVEIAKPYGDGSLERPWSKYSRGSSAHQQWERKKVEKESSAEREKRRQKERQQRVDQDVHKSKLSKLLGEYYDLKTEEQFQEFLAAHEHGSQVQTWADSATGKGSKDTKMKGSKDTKMKASKDTQMKCSKDTKMKASEGGGKERRKAKVKPMIVSVEAKRPGGEGILMTRTHLKFEDSGGESGVESDPMETDESGAGVRGMGDLEYLRSKVVRGEEVESGSSEEEGGDGDGEGEDSDKDEAGDGDGDGGEGGQGRNIMATTPYTLKMRGLPFRATEEDVHTFFYPLDIVSVRLTTDQQGRPSGRAYVDFSSESDLRNALRRNNDCIGRRYIELFRDDGPQSSKTAKTEEEEPKPWELKAALTDSSQDESIAESGRLFARNLPYSATEEHLTDLFQKFGPLTEVTVPLDKNTNKPTGVAFITFMLPEHAVRAYEALDGQIFQGRLLHLLPAKSRQSQEEGAGSQVSASFKRKREERMKSQAGSGHNWNTLFLGANAVVDAMAERYSTEKGSILDPESAHSAAVRMALGETLLVSETREFLRSHGVKLDLFEQSRPKRSTSIILVKNLPFGTTEDELHRQFSPFGALSRVVLPPAGISALVEFLESSHAKIAFKKLAYTKFKHLPLYLEWAPLGVMDGEVREVTAKPTEDKESEAADGQHSTVFVKNLNFSTNEESLRSHFSKVGEVRTVSIAKKRNTKDPTHPLSMGFGFVEFASHELAARAVKEIQHSNLDGHKLELKLSHRETHGPRQGKKTAAKSVKQKSAKILVRNIPFEANKKEVRELFRTFGELKTVRLPKKFSTQGEHRGFGFVEFLTKEDAKRAFEALSHSTHLYGRRLVLEWAEEDESVEAIRKRTAEHFHGLRVPSSKKRKDQDLLSLLENPNIVC